MFILKVIQEEKEVPLRYKGKVMAFDTRDILEDYIEVAYPGHSRFLEAFEFEGNPKKAYILREKSPRIGGRC